MKIQAFPFLWTLSSMMDILARKGEEEEELIPAPIWPPFGFI
jgi:hypothetical protein